MSCKVEKKRRQEKYTTTTGDRATVPAQSDVCDFTESTAIMKGEWYINFADGTIENRYNSGIGQVPFVTPTASDDGKATVYDHANKKFILSEVAVNLNILGSVYLVSENGDNDTAVAGDLSKPWADPWAARDAWVTGGSIGRVVILPGSYTIPVAYTDTDTNASLLRDGIVIAGLPGAEIITDTAKAQFYDVTGMTTKIYGQIIFRNTAGNESSWFHNIYVQHANSNHEWHFQEMNVQSFFAWHGGGIIRTNGKMFSERAGQYRFRPQMNNTKWYHKGDIVAQGIGSPEIGGDPDTLATWWQVGQIGTSTYTGCEVEFRGNMYNYGWGGSQFSGVIWAISTGVDGSGAKVDIRGDIYCPFSSVNKQDAIICGIADDTYFEGNVYAPYYTGLWGLDAGTIYGTNSAKIIINKAQIVSRLTSVNAESTLLYDRVRGYTGYKFEFYCNALVTDGECYSIGGNAWTNGMIISGSVRQEKYNTDCFQMVGTQDINVENLKVIMPPLTTGDIFSASGAMDVYVNGNTITNNPNLNDVNVTLNLQSIYSNVNVR